MGAPMLDQVEYPSLRQCRVISGVMEGKIFLPEKMRHGNNLVFGFEVIELEKLKHSVHCLLAQRKSASKDFKSAPIEGRLENYHGRNQGLGATQSMSTTIRASKRGEETEPYADQKQACPQQVLLEGHRAKYNNLMVPYALHRLHPARPYNDMNKCNARTVSSFYQWKANECDITQQIVLT